ncbi:MAG: hypothetical protein V2I33_01040 [Kangiellaceae bacterium]|nr:hypothetical protein [Kangiellaceae bacterium]
MTEIFQKDIIMLPDELTDSARLTEQFSAMLGSSHAAKDRGIVYFYLSKEPVTTEKGHTNILYIGKTKGSIKSRYFQYAKKLSSGRNKDFYSNIIDNYGGVSMGYVVSELPRKDEKRYFVEYRRRHGQNPPKSKRG